MSVGSNCHILYAVYCYRLYIKVYSLGYSPRPYAGRVEAEAEAEAGRLPRIRTAGVTRTRTSGERQTGRQVIRSH